MKRFIAWIAGLWKNRSSTPEERDAWSTTAKRFANLLVKDASMVVFVATPSSLWVSVNRLTDFNALDRKIIEQLIEKELEGQLESYELEIKTTEDPAVFKIRITNVEFIHHRPVVSI
jgi:hypothetical protein